MTVLRGGARVFQRSGEASDAVAITGAGVTLAQGLQGDFARRTAIANVPLEIPLSKKIGALVRATTPFYAAAQDMSGERAGEDPSSASRRPSLLPRP